MFKLNLSDDVKYHLLSALHSIVSFMLFELAAQILSHQNEITALTIDRALLGAIAFAVLRAGTKAAIPFVVEGLKSLAQYLKNLQK